MSPGLVDVGPALEKICTEVVAADAASVDHDGAFPERGVRALAAAGLRGAVSAPEVGGLGLGFRGAATIVGRLAQDCGSTAMVACMHHPDEHSALEVQRSQRGLLGGHHGERRAADGPACERRPLRASQIGYLLVKRAVRRAAPGESIEVTGHAADLHVHLRAWCRAEGHRFDWQPVPGKAHGRALVHAGAAESERFAGAHHAGARRADRR